MCDQFVGRLAAGRGDSLQGAGRLRFHVTTLHIHNMSARRKEQLGDRSRLGTKSKGSPLAQRVLSAFAGLSGPRYFVDLAANHPTIGSSTFELEQKGWHGLCIEPNPEYFSLLRRQRTCKVSTAAVDAVVRNVTFRFAGETGGIEDNRFDNRAGTRKDDVASDTLTTKTFQKVLRGSGAPAIIDYLNLDVEGAESSVLPSTFPWNEFVFLTLTIERPPPDLNARLFSNGCVTASLL